MPESYAWFLALRYLLGRAIHLVGLIGIAVAAWALVLVIAVFSGMVSQIHDNVYESSAELLVTELAVPTSYAAVQALVEADPDVACTSPRLSQVGIYVPNVGLLRPGTGTSHASQALEQKPAQHNFAVFLGIDPEREARTTALTRWLTTVSAPSMRVQDPARPFWVSAERVEKASLFMRTANHAFAAEPTERGCVLGLTRMRALQAANGSPIPGQRIDVFGALLPTDGETRDPRPLSFYVHVSGAFTTHYSAVESAYAFMPIDQLRKSLGYDPDLVLPPNTPLDVVSEVAVRARPGADLDALKARLSPEVKDRFSGTVLTWKEQHTTYLSAVEHERALMKVALFVVLLVAAFMIYAMLHMMVMQKVKDIGILTALGATPRGIAAIFLLCGLLVAAAGAALGTGLGIWSAIHVDEADRWAAAHLGFSLFPPQIYMIEQIPHRLEPKWLAQVVLFTMGLAFFVSWLPARRAARLSPVEALAHE